MLTSLLSGFAVSAALIAAIGAQNAFVLRQGLRREHVGPVVLFCALSDFVLITAGVAGLGAALGEMPRLALWLAVGGGLFLGGYGIAALRRATRPSHLVPKLDSGGLTLGAALAQAAAFTLLNPHVYLDTVVLIGAVGAAQPVGGAIPFIAGAALASAFWFSALGYGARLIAPLFAKPAAWRVLDAVVGVTMLALSAGLFARAALPG